MRNIWNPDETVAAVMGSIKAGTNPNYMLKSYNLQQQSNSNDGKPSNRRNYYARRNPKNIGYKNQKKNERKRRT